MFLPIILTQQATDLAYSSSPFPTALLNVAALSKCRKTIRLKRAWSFSLHRSKSTSIPRSGRQTLCPPQLGLCFQQLSNPPAYSLHFSQTIFLGALLTLSGHLQRIDVDYVRTIRFRHFKAVILHRPPYFMVGSPPAKISFMIILFHQTSIPRLSTLTSTTRTAFSETNSA